MRTDQKARFTYTSLLMGRGLVGRFVTSQYWSVIAVLLCKALVHVAAYPLCTDLCKHKPRIS